MKQWLHSVCSNLIWNVDFKEFLLWGCLFIEMLILANIKQESLQFTFLKWSRDWLQHLDTLNKSPHNFCPNLNWTTHFKTFLFWDCLFTERTILANIKLEVLQPIFLKCSREWWQNLNILICEFITFSKFDLNPRFKGVFIIGWFTYQHDYFAKYQIGSTAVYIFEMVTWLMAKSQRFELVTRYLRTKFDLKPRFQGVSIWGILIHRKINFSKYHVGSTLVHSFEMVTWLIANF